MSFSRLRRAQSLIEVSILIALVALVLVAILSAVGPAITRGLGPAVCALTGGGASCINPSPSNNNSNTLVLTPNPASAIAGTSHSFSAFEYDRSGGFLGDRTASSTFSILPNGSCTLNVCTSTVSGPHQITASTTTASGQSSFNIAPGPPTSLVLSPASASVPAGTAQNYAATSIDTYGNLVNDLTANATFTISPSGSCSLNACTATTTGTYTISATANGLSSTTSVTLTILPATLSTITLSPSSSSVTVSTPQAYTATGFDTLGNSLGNVTSATTFTISSSGTCTTNSCSSSTPGSYTVTGTDSGHSASATLIVNAGAPDHILLTPASVSHVAGTSQAYSSTAYDASGNPLGDVTPSTTFTISPDGSCNGALCVAGTIGVHTITGTDSGKTATATYTVTAGGLDHILLAPASSSIAAGGAASFSATSYDAYGNSLALVTSSTTFSSSSGSCTLNSCTSTTLGSDIITGSYSSKTATATLTVTVGALNSITLTPPSATHAAGIPQTYVIDAYDAYGNALGDVTSSSGLSITPDGSCAGAVCTATVPGAHTLNASYSGFSASATLNITASTTASITISPSSATIPADGSQVYTVQGFDSYSNSTGNLTAVTTFSISPDGTCNLNSCSATSLSVHTVTATYTGHTASSALTVTPGSLSSIAITPTGNVIPAGNDQTFSSTAFDAFGNSLGDVTSSTTFSITPNGSCTLNVCTASVVGSHTVTGTDAGHSATATLTFTSGSLASLQIAPLAALVSAGSAQIYTTTGFDSFGNSLGNVTSDTTFSITPNGLCTSNSCTASISGSHTITATDGGYTATTTLTIAAASPTSILLSPTSASIVAGGAQSFTANAFDQYGNPAGNVTASTTFTLSPNGSCTLASCTASAIGSHTVTGAYSGLTSTATLTVTSGAPDHIILAPASASIVAGSSQSYTASAYDSFDNLIGAVTSSTTFSIASNGSCTLAVCTASAVGAHTVTGTYSGLTSTASLTVTPNSLSSITIAPTSTSIVAGSSQTYTATGFDSFGNPLGDATASTTFTISPDGSCTNAVCTATNAISHTVTGTDSSLTAFATLTVNPSALNHIVINPTSSSILAGSTQSYTTTAFDQYNNSLGLVTAGTTFASSAGASCTNAVCTSTLSSTYTITATYSAHTATASLTVGAASMSSITLSPSSTSVIAGASQTYVSTGYDTYGNSRGDVTASTVFSLAPDGSCSLAACTPSVTGTHTVTGNDAGITATATLTVTPGPLSSITIAPSSSTVLAGVSQTYTATGFDSFGNAIGDATSSTTFTILPDGSCAAASCTATAVGAHTVTGTDSGHTTNSTLTVNPAALDHLVLSPASSSITAGNSQTYTSIGFDVYNNSRGDLTAFTVFTISPNGSCATASCTATAVGAHTVTGASSTKTGTSTLTVTPGALSSITISPSSASITAGTSQVYSANGFDAYNNPLGVVTPSTVFTISPDGSCTTSSCTASVIGSHTVTATDAGHTATSSLTVTAAALANITISPASATIVANASQTYTATSFDSFGNTIGDATSSTAFTITGSASSCTLAVCTSTLAGAHTVTGTNTGHVATATLTINAGPLASITISPTSASIVAGASQTYVTNGFDAYNNPLGVVTVNTTFTITPDGSCTTSSCTASVAGTHTVTATDAGHTANSTLTVTVGALASITISPSSASIVAGASQTYSATGFDSFGNSLGSVTGATTFTVPSGSCALAVCTPSTTVGTYTVTGNDTGNTANASLTVTAGPLASITISPTSASIVAGTSQTFTTAGFDAFGNPLGSATGATTFTISPDGSCTTNSCTATLIGVHTVTGTDAGHTATSSLTVTPAALSSITVAPASASIVAGASQTYTASGFDTYNNPRGDVTAATVFSITPDGSCTLAVCTASVVGIHTVTGTNTGHTANATLTITVGALSSITIAPGSTAITAGGSQVYSSTSYDSFGNTIGSATAQTVFGLTPDGSCTAASCTASIAGAHTVTGTDSGHTATATLTVNAGALNSITISPASSTITAGASQTYTTNGFDSFSNPLGDVTAATIFTISGSGSSCTLAVCTSTLAAVHTVTATDTGHTATSTLTVNAAALASITVSPTSSTITAGASQTYVTNGFDAFSNPLGVVTPATVFTITPNGSCTAAACTASVAGTHTVTATDTGHTATSTLTVNAAALSSITIAPTSTTIVANTSQAYTATSFDTFGNTIGDATGSTVFTITGASSSCTLAVCTSTLSGAHTVTGTNTGHTATATLTVNAAALDHLVLAPASSSIVAGNTQTYTATGFDVYNNSLGLVTGATVFTVPSGSCTGAVCTPSTTVGTYTVTGTDATKTGTASLTVTVGALSSITLSPASSTITAGTSQTYVANGFDVYSNSLGVVTGATTFSVPSGSCTLAVCTPSTTVSTYTVTGNDAGHTATSSLTVSAAALSSITIAPASATITANGSQVYSANGFDQYGNALGVVTGATTFSITPNGSCTTSSCTTTASGAHTVTGTDASHTANATLTVNPGALATITISPASSSITAGTSQTYTAASFDSFGNNAGDVTASTTFTITGASSSCTLAVCTSTLSGVHTVTGTNTGHTSNSTLTVTGAALSSITIAPASASVVAGGSQTYTANSFDTYGNTLGDATGATTFSITPNGSCTLANCTASVVGAHTVTGNDAGHTANATLTITVGALSSITISPASSTIAANATQTYTATSFDSFGNTIGDATTSTTFTITGAASSCTLAVCTSTLSGAHTVTGTNTGHTANATLTILAGALDHLGLTPASSSIVAGSSQTYTVTGFDLYNNSLGDVTGATTLSITPDGSCNNVAHTCTASTVGAHTVTGTDATKTGTSTLTITAGALSSITISPTSSAIIAGGTQAYTSTGFDSFGNSLGSATGATVFTITPNGSCTLANCTASITGVHTVTATDAGHTATSSLTVNAAAPATITIAPASATIVAGGSQAYTATGFDSFGNNAGDVTVATIFTVLPDGSCNGALCSATAVGAHTVTGNDSGKTANSTLTINAGALATITISPTSSSVVAGGSQVYSANGFDPYGNALGVVTGATTFSITPDGSCTTSSCTASVAGVHTVTGNDAGHTATSTLTITVGALASITISPASATIVANAVQAYTSTGFDAFGNSLGSATGATTFSITPDGSCTLANCTATVASAHTVTGTDAGHTATATLTVNAGALDHLVLTPASSSVVAGGSQTYTSTGFDVYNNTLGLVTGATTFSITPDGSCTTSSCTASVAGIHTVTGIDATKTGTSTLTITAGALNSITIAPASTTMTAGGTQAYTSTGFDSFGNSLGSATGATIFTITGASSSCTLANCTSTLAGAHTVTGTDSGHTANGTLTVNAAALDHLGLIPASSSIVAGNSQTYTVTGFDVYNNTLGDVTAATTLSITPNGACDNVAHSCTATIVGAHTVTGTDTAKTGTSTLTITVAPLNSITIAPASATITAGGSQVYTANGFDQYGNALGDVTGATVFNITLASSSCTLANCTSTLAGAHTVTGTDSGHTANATLTINAAALANITISPASSSITAGTTQTYSANGFDTYGNALGLVTGATVFTVPSGACTLAVCTPSTLAAAYTVTGNDSGHTATATLTVQAAALDHLTLAPSVSTINAGTTQTFTAQGFDVYNNSKGDVTAATTFTLPSGSCTLAVCTPSTLAAVYTVTGTDATKTGTASLTVQAAALDHLTLSPASSTINAGTTQTYTANGFDIYNNSKGDVTGATTFTVPGGSCTLAVCTPSTTISTYTVTGTDVTKTGTASLTVQAAALDHLTLAPSAPSILAGTTQTFTATGFDVYGNTKGDVTGATVFTVPSGSCVGAVCTPSTTAGTYTVTGTDATKTGTASLTVTAAALDHLGLAPSSSSIVAGTTQTYTATGFDVYGNTKGVVTGATVFTVPGGSCTAAVCTPSTTVNTYTVTGTDATKTGTASLTVTVGALASITIAPASSSITAGGTQTYSANGFDAYGNAIGVVTGATVFSVPSGSCTGAVCTPSTVATSYTVTGTNAGHTATASLTVNPGALANITIAPASSSITAGTTQTYTATALDSFGNTIGPATGATVFSIPSGSCTAAVCTPSTVAAAYTVTGTDAGHTANASLTVTAAALDHLGLAPASTSINAGTSQTYTATGFDVYNNTKGDVTGATVFSVPSGSCAAAVCTPSTLAAVYTVTGTDATKTGTASLTVLAAALDHLVLAPASNSIVAGTTQTYTATGFDVYNNTKGDVTGATVFTVPGGACAAAVCTPPTTISTYTVTGTDATKTGTASLTVLAAALDHLALAPASTSISAGTTQTYTATGFDVYGNTRGDVTGATVFTVPSGSCVAAVCTPSTVAAIYTVTGTDATKTGTASLTVQAAALDHLVLAPASTSITAGTTQTYVSTGFDVYNNSLGVVTGATVFSVPSGSCTAAVCTPSTAAGTYTVTGTDATKTGTASLTVTAGALASITISPLTATITVDTTQTFAATGFDTYGNTKGTVTGATTFTITGVGTCSVAACGSHTPGTYTVTGNDAGHTASTTTNGLTVTIGALASITISPNPSAPVRTGTAVTYTATGFDQYGNSLGNVTGATTFTDAGVSCGGFNCTNATDGSKTIVATNAGHTASTTQTSTTCTVGSTTENYPGGAKESTSVIFTANGGTCTGGLTPEYYFAIAGVANSGWQAGNTYTTSTAAAGTRVVTTYVEVNTGAGNWPVTGGSYGQNYDWTTCTLTNVTLPAGVGVGPRAPGPTSTWTVTATGSCTGAVAPSYDYLIEDGAFTGKLDSGQLGNTTTWQWNTATYPGSTTAADGNTKVVVGIMSDNERLARGLTTFLSGSNTGASPGYLFWNGGANFLFAECTADVWTVGGAAYTPNASPYNVTVTQVGTCSAGATPTYMIAEDALGLCGFATTCNTLAINYDDTTGGHSQDGTVAPLGDEAHWSTADADGGVSGFQVSKTVTITANCWSLRNVAGGNASTNGNTSRTQLVTATCNPGTLATYTVYAREDCQAVCPPPHCYINLSAGGCTYFGSGGGWGNASDGAYWRHPSGNGFSTYSGASNANVTISDEHSAYLTPLTCTPSGFSTQPYYDMLVVEGHGGTVDIATPAFAITANAVLCYPTAQW